MPAPRTIALAVASTLLGACAATTPRPSQPVATWQVEVPRIARPGGETPAWWFRDGAAQAAGRGAMAGNAKNVILFVGDGMSLTTVAAARIFDGQRKGASGEENRLSWENFPATALSRTYNTDAQTPDSAGTMSAMATGVKTRAGVLSIGQEAKLGDCEAALKTPMLTLWELAAASGLSTGIVTTTRVTHATPGAAFTHSAHRNWENDTTMARYGVRAQGCTDIARQLVESPYGNGLDVLMGGGRANFLPSSIQDPEYADKNGARSDGRDLVSEWQGRHPGGAYAWNATQLAAAPIDQPLLALFEPGHMRYEHERSRDRAGEPSLAEMTRAAITRLQRNDKGYVLLVEGGRIDHAHHNGNAYRALTDTVALSEAVQAAAEMTSEADTLILVTADHAHTLSFSGYPERGNPILGKVHGASDEENEPADYPRDLLGLPYTTLSYANGPGYVGESDKQAAGSKHHPHEPKRIKPAVGRPDLTSVDTTDPDYMQEAIVPLSQESHGGEDVGIWARGPGSSAVRGSVEQNAIFHFMLQATPALRQRLCEAGACDANGVPVELPRPGDFRPE